MLIINYIIIYEDKQSFPFRVTRSSSGTRPTTLSGEWRTITWSRTQRTFATIC